MITETEVITVVIDGSDSMNGETREKVIKGVNDLINFIK